MLKQKITPLIDLTSLNESDTEETINDLCQRAVTPWGHVAAVCVYPHFVSLAVKNLQNTNVKIAAVANFPSGNLIFSEVKKIINGAIANGAQEIDVVFPYHDYLAGNKSFASDFVKQCKEISGTDILLKVILESAVFPNLELLLDASREALLNGADFLKTSTGKIHTGATLEAAEVMLTAICELTPRLNRKIGFKASGGIRTWEQAARYVDLAEKIMGPEWVTSRTFRLGTSRLG